MKRYKALEVWFHTKLTLALGGGKWFASDAGDIKKREKGPITHYTGGWLGQKGSLEAMEKRKVAFPCLKSNPHSLVKQPVALPLL
jgi:hypothetical protein